MPKSQTLAHMQVAILPWNSFWTPGQKDGGKNWLPGKILFTETFKQGNS